MMQLTFEDNYVNQISAGASFFIASIFFVIIILLSIIRFIYVTRFEKLRGESKELGYCSDFMFQGIHNERKRISRDLHDTVCQNLRAIRIENEPLQGLQFGMTNMKQRAQELGAEFEVISEPGDGTKIRLEVPVQ